MTTTGIIVLVVAGIIFLLIVFCLVWWVKTSNRLKAMSIKVDESASGIDVALTMRFDLLTKSVATVKGYAKHESETLTNVIAMRQPAKDAPMKEKSEFNAAVDRGFADINVVMEQYPDLKANSNFMALQNQIKDVEDHLQSARRVYNSNVTNFNKAVVMFPSSIVANHLKLQEKDFFEAEDKKRQDVEISFD